MHAEDGRMSEQRPSDTKLIPSSSEPVPALGQGQQLGDYRRFQWDAVDWGHSSEVGAFASKRFGHTLRVVGGRLYVVGGNMMSATYLCYLDLVTLEWHDLTQKTDGPRFKKQHSSTLVDDFIYLWGGELSEEARSQELWRFDTCAQEWWLCEYSGEVPAGRKFLSFEYVERRAEIIVFGGEDVSGLSRGLSAFSLASSSWYMPLARGSEPKPRRRHGTCVVGSTMYIFGGYDVLTKRVLDELYLLHCEGQLRWTKPRIEGPVPAARQNPTLTNCGGKLLLCGGFGTECYQDLWFWSIAEGEWKAVVEDPEDELLNEEYTMGGKCPKAWLHADAYTNNTLFLVGSHFVSGNKHAFYTLKPVR